MKMLNDFIQKIGNPGSGFRGAPFWAWNSKLEPEELRRQIRNMKQMGLGGFFMHSRVGLNTEYLGDEWFECIRACIDEAEKQGMNAWLYDEDRWPSGAGGGFVTKDIRFRRRNLQIATLKTVDYKDGDLAWFAARIDGTAAYSPRRLKQGEALHEGETFLRFHVQIDEPNSWYNGQTYLDTMNPEAVKKFIEVTHEKYAKEIPESLGKTVPGIFTDEPNYSTWTDGVPARFREMYGYDLLDHLPELYYDVDGKKTSRVRLNYYNVLTDLFVSSFSKQIGEWCERHNMEFTGHVLCEDNVVSQTWVVGAAMRFYEYMQSPGIDLLTEHWNIFNTAKQCVSMAHQFGRKTRLSETYGCTGWDFPFEGHKALGDWQTALGINLRCQHLAWYSMEAEAKRDYPASISYQSPWCKRYPAVEDYFARLNAALSEGEEIRNLLVIHPIESTWFGRALCLCSEQELNEEKNRLVHLSNQILKDNVDFDFGDEEVMSRHGSVSGGTISIAKASYKAVLIPEMRTIRKTTLALLKEFAQNGGQVVYIGDAPEFVDGFASDEAKEIYRLFTRTTPANAAKDVENAAREVSVTENCTQIAPILYGLRRAGDLATLFLCNTSLDWTDEQMDVPMVRDRALSFENAEVAWKLPEEWDVYELNLSNGERYAVSSEYRDGKRIFRTSFARLESRLFIACAENIANAERKPEKRIFQQTVRLPERWNATIDDFNVFVLDHASYSIDGSYYSLKDYILKIDGHLREILGKQPRGGAMVQPWLSAKEKTPERTLDLKLRYEFECEFLPDELYLGIERPDLYTCLLNGTEFKAEECGFWCDRSMRKLKLPVDLLKKGINHLELRTAYHELMPGLEAIFLLGSFGVRGETITALPDTLNIGDWCSQGFQNYAGNLTCRTTFLRPDSNGSVILEIPAWRGVALGVSVNGSEQTMLPWPPYRLDISQYLKDGENTLEIEVYGHRRNSHGPFYLHEKWPAWTGPAQFRFYQETERQLVPCGLLETPLLKY